MRVSPKRLLAVVSLFFLSATALPAAEIRLLAHSTIDSETAAGPTIPAAVSENGRHLLLRSVAPNLIAGQVDENGAADLFLRDRESGSTTLISHRAGEPSRAGDQGSLPKAMTPDGEWVLYTSWASDLVAGLVPSAYSTDVYLWRRSTGESVLVSHLPGQPLKAAGKSRAAALTADGAFVLFESEAAGLAAGAGDTNLTTDVFVWSRATGNVTLISAIPGGAAGNGASTATGLREDGLEIFFSSFATDLVPGDGNGREDGFVRDLAAASTSGPLAAAGARAHAASANGRYLLLQSSTAVLLLDRRTGELREISSSSAASPVALAADGSAALFDQGGHTYLYRRATAQATCLSCGLPSGSGLAVAAAGGVALFTALDGSGTQQVHLYDAATGISEAVTRQANGEPAPAGGYTAAMSADGRHFSFASRDASLDPAVADRNGTEDAFFFTRGEPGVELESRAGIALPVATTRGLGSAPTGQSADGEEILFSGPADLLDPRHPNDSTAAWAYHAGSGARRLLSPLPGQPGVPAGAFSSPLALARDGRTLLNSNAAGLVPGALPGIESQLYLYSPAAGGSYRLITGRGDAPLVGTSGYLTAVSFDPELSRAAFLSAREGLVAGVDPEGSPQLFLCDLKGAGCTLLSAAAGDPGRPADDGLTSLAASRDLATLIFASRASDLAAGASGDRSHLYSWRRGSGVELLSRSAGSPGVEANGETWPADLSADGRFVLATSLATDLVSGLIDGNGVPDVFLFDSLAGTWELVSSGLLGLPANSRSQGLSVSADGRFVLFMSAATDLVPGQVDDPPFYPPVEGPQDLFLLDRNTGEKTLVSHLPGRRLEAAGYFYFFGSLSEDGSRVAYLSTSPRLLPGEPEGLISTWLWDQADGEPQLLAASTGGPYFPGAFPIFLETRFFDGSLLPLSSWNGNFLPGDSNGVADAYLILLDGLFRDGFESADTGAWSATVP